jgi:pimeloyl-ACP methyl ester carboxylesterase
VVLLVHGLMCTEAVWRFRDADAAEACDYGTLLAADLGYTPLYLRYNTGLAIAANGAALADLLARLTAAWPREVEELLLVGHSLGGLVVRSACVLAGRGAAWRQRVRRTISIGTPHLGSPVERAGRWASGLLRTADGPYTRLLADLGDLRSDGIKDLGDADLRHRDRAQRRRGVRPAGWRHPVALPGDIAHCLVAGESSRDGRLGALVDALVPVASATAADGSLAPAEVRVLRGVGHLELARHPAVYALIREWCEAA